MTIENNTTKRAEIIAAAERLLGITVHQIGRGLAYHAPEADGFGWFWLTLDDLRDAIEMGPITDLYSHWCAATVPRPVSQRVLVREGLV